MLNKSTIEKGIRYCCEDISLIENYEEAVNSPKRYCCHHRLGLEVSYKDLIEKGLYYDRPAAELIFLELGEHSRLHNQNLREETRKKRSGENNGMYNKGYLIAGKKNGMYGKHLSDETKQKMSDTLKGKTKGAKHYKAKQCTINGTTYGSLVDAYRELKPNYTYVAFINKYNKGTL